MLSNKWIFFVVLVNVKQIEEIKYFFNFFFCTVGERYSEGRFAFSDRVGICWEICKI